MNIQTFTGSCRTPKKIFISDSRGYEKVVYCTCGTCWFCRGISQGQWVARVKSECEIRFPFFITLTYDNDHLPVYEPVLVDYNFSRKKYISMIMSQHKLKRKWDFSFVRKDHLRDFFKDLQLSFQKYFPHLFHRVLYKARNGNTFYRVVPRPEYELTNTYLIRRYATGEYGSFSHRAHYHALIFIPCKCHRSDVLKMVRECWPFGHVDVAKDCREAAVAYVAKHQLKSDSGSVFQRRLFPIFRSVSTYKGGIGYNLYTEENYNWYVHTDEEGNYDHRFIDVIDSSCRHYTVPMPRFLLAKFRKRYARENNITTSLTDEELEDLSKKTVKIFLSDFLKFVSCTPDAQSLDRDQQLQYFYSVSRVESYRKQSEYFKKNYAKKKMKLIKKYGFTLKDLDNEPI